MEPAVVAKLLNKQFYRFHSVQFIENDPISVPHRFTKKQDIEIAAFFAAIFAWGQRKTIIYKANALMQLMDDSPHDFVLHHQAKDLKKLLGFKHRTFNADDLLYCIYFMHRHYQQHNSLETAFFPEKFMPVEMALNHFKTYFFDSEFALLRTRKHISSPDTKSACKRLNMFLRWMLRKNSPVDFGIWESIESKELICPLDVHVSRVARNLGLITRKQDDWQTALELTENLKKFDANDPVKYDYALFGMGVVKNN